MYTEQHVSTLGAGRKAASCVIFCHLVSKEMLGGMSRIIEGFRKDSERKRIFLQFCSELCPFSMPGRRVFEGLRGKSGKLKGDVLC